MVNSMRKADLINSQITLVRGKLFAHSFFHPFSKLIIHVINVEFSIWILFKTCFAIFLYLNKQMLEMMMEKGERGVGDTTCNSGPQL